MTTVQIKHRDDSLNVLVVTSNAGGTLRILPGETLDTQLREGYTLTLREESPRVTIP